jgi:pyruvate dehydrogenase E2 component (dihydrolipoamide acetyltransferase)/2-oxoglutarate dehydrogenase E2 component (dihydrolipoamide succinyltransferase)
MVDVIMPALGMAQDTGKLLQWLKAPGDPVAVGDQLFEVETDKSVMEVEAQEAGFLTQVSASDGDDVPVGQVIAVISATADNAVAAAPDPAPVAQPTAEPEPKAAWAPSSAPVPTATGDKILASPKARRLAAEEGLDLGQLAAAGATMPYHVSDLETLRTLPAPVAAVTASGQTTIMVATKQITARCQRQGSLDFIDWIHSDGGITVTPTAMFASFAAGAFRAATETATIVVQISGPETDDTFLQNPDFTRLSMAAQETDEATTFVLHDLSDSFLTSLRLGDTALPTLSIGMDGDAYALTFEFSSDHLANDQAIAFVNGLARRLADPLHHLV